VAFGALIWEGLTLPCVGLRIHPAWFALPEWHFFEPAFDRIDAEAAIDTDVTLLECMRALASWAEAGELNCVAALVMLAIFAVGLTLLDVVCLLVAAVSAAQGRRALSSGALALAHVLHHVSMLGPAVMGVAVICLVGGSYKDQGVEFLLMPGLAWLFGAEVAHYSLFYLVDWYA